jgi:hypothetical protein
MPKRWKRIDVLGRETHDRAEQREYERYLGSSSNGIPKVERRPSESSNPVKCHFCSHWLTEKGRRRGVCTECGQPIPGNAVY